MLPFSCLSINSRSRALSNDSRPLARMKYSISVEIAPSLLAVSMSNAPAVSMSNPSKGCQLLINCQILILNNRYAGVLRLLRLKPATLGRLSVYGYGYLYLTVFKARSDPATGTRIFFYFCFGIFKFLFRRRYNIS